jgi:hypothetical protein
MNPVYRQSPSSFSAKPSHPRRRKKDTCSIDKKEQVPYPVNYQSLAAIP